MGIRTFFDNGRLKAKHNLNLNHNKETKVINGRTEQTFPSEIKRTQKSLE
jgi:hypothetical protein